MSNTARCCWSSAAFYVLGIVLLVAIFGFGHKNNAFQIQNEFKLVNWVHLGRVQHQPGGGLPVPRRRSSRS